jgi:hypothetical protein
MSLARILGRAGRFSPSLGVWRRSLSSSQAPAPVTSDPVKETSASNDTTRDTETRDLAAQAGPERDGGGGGPKTPAGPVSWISVLLLTVTGSAFVAYYQYRRALRLKVNPDPPNPSVLFGRAPGLASSL